MTCAYAATSGHLELLKWARSNGCPWDEGTFNAGQKFGDPALMRYLEESSPFIIQASLVYTVAINMFIKFCDGKIFCNVHQSYCMILKY
jgi:hypothetical protein